MKIEKKLFAVICLFLMVCCTTEPIEKLDALDNRESVNSDSTDIDFEANSEEEDEACITTTLIAGQHYESGTVSISIVDGNLIVTYLATEDWTLGTTHLSIGNCDDDWIPLNGGGNPQIGQFEFTEPTSVSETEVIYIIPLPEDFENQDYCFAAHAEVQGPDGGETAWAEGTQLSGNSWAMYNTFNTSDCVGDSNGGGGAF